MKISTQTVLVIFLVSLITSLLTLFAYSTYVNTPDQQKKSYYQNSVSTLQSPHGYREQMHKGYTDYVLVDTRAKQDYINGHITGAFNIDSSQSIDQVVEQFSALDQKYEKPILIYCYSASCMNGRKIGALLAEHGIYVHELTIGYNEWEFYPEVWNYPEDWENLNIEDYITRGKEPGELTPNLEQLLDGCSIEGELFC